MNYSNFKTDWNKPSKFIAEHYGTKVTVEYDHSDLSFDEVMDAFETLVIGMGYHKDAWKEWILERADEYREEDMEQEVKEPYTYQDFKRDEELVRSVIKSKLNTEDYEGQFEDWENETVSEPFLTEEEITEVLNEVQTETFSDKPTTLNETSSIEDEKKMQIVQICSDVEYQMIIGRREIIQYDLLIIMIMNIISKKDKS